MSDTIANPLINIYVHITSAADYDSTSVRIVMSVSEEAFGKYITTKIHKFPHYVLYRKLKFTYNYSDSTLYKIHGLFEKDIVMYEDSDEFRGVIVSIIVKDKTVLTPTFYVSHLVNGINTIIGNAGGN